MLGREAWEKKEPYVPRSRSVYSILDGIRGDAHSEIPTARVVNRKTPSRVLPQPLNSGLASSRACQVKVEEKKALRLRLVAGATNNNKRERVACSPL
jgi:hypothetical protein